MASPKTKSPDTTWALHAMVASSNEPNKQYRVDINGIGAFRCTCPAFIFSKTRPKTCKHTRACQKEIDNPHADLARQIFVAMVTAAYGVHSATRIDADGWDGRKMREELSRQLMKIKPTTVKAVTAMTTTASGVRVITFDDDDE